MRFDKPDEFFDWNCELFSANFHFFEKKFPKNVSSEISAGCADYSLHTMLKIFDRMEIPNF